MKPETEQRRIMDSLYKTAKTHYWIMSNVTKTLADKKTSPAIQLKRIKTIIKTGSKLFFQKKLTTKPEQTT